VARAGALLTGLLVLMLSVLSSVVTARDKQLAAQDSQLGIVLGQQLGILESYFERARTIDALLAANPVFTDFYRAPGTNDAKIRAGGPLIDRVNEALAYLEELYPGRIGEACFIDSSGAEIARVVDGVRAAPADLSQDEDANPFFAPTLAFGEGRVYQAKMYKSPDTHNEVISNSTVITAGGHTGIVHYEIALDTFRMTDSGNGVAASIVDADTGHTILDSRTQGIAGATTDQSWATMIQRGLAAEVTTVQDRRVAYRRLPVTDGNANNWYVAVSAPQFGLGWTRGLGVKSLALLAAALLTIIVSGASWVGHLRSVRRLASYDPLTGLPNRTLFTQRLQAALRPGRGAAVLLIDLERFKEVNDALGYRYGDQLLQQVARRLTAELPATTVARLGGDDFAVLLPGRHGDDVRTAEAAADQILAVLHRTFTVEGTGMDLEASIGVAWSAEPGLSAEALLRHADAAMNRAKEHHTGRETYDPTDEQHSPHRLQLLGDLRRAIESEDQILVHYQPKVDLETGRAAGVEALVRWEHPEQGCLMPDTFIPLAENTTLIRGLTARVLDIAVRQAKCWLDQGRPVPVAVNLSTRCLLDATLPDHVFDLLTSVGLPTSLLELEITESTAMADPDRARSILHALHEGGIRLSIDDFGTGHSSMAYLQQLPVDELKIDRSFVAQMIDSEGSAVLVRTAITLGHNLGLLVVAEGVETADMVAALRDLGCDIAQGYHYSRPVSAPDVERWLANCPGYDPARRAA
ncbi:MAG TPA: EAL domain-containing protein, partial [Actinoplanes sp.]